MSNVVHDDAFKINIKNSSITKFINSTILDFAVTTFNMNVTDYWPMARKYLIWNTAIASLQFWTADLDRITLSRAMEEVYSAFFYSTATHTLHQQSVEILFICFMTTLNAAFEVMRAVQTLLTCLLHSEKCQEFTIYPASNTLHLTLIQSCHKTHFKLCPGQYADDYCSVHQITVTLQKISSLLPEPLQQVHQYA